MSKIAESLDRLAGYPGRGIALYKPAGDAIRWLYFVTGRSPASRSRRFELSEDTLRVVSTERPATRDPLRHYVCATRVPSTNALVIGNGDHVEQIASQLESGLTLEVAAQGISPEPDPPINTPRIAAVVEEDRVRTLAVFFDEAARTRRRIDDFVPEEGAAVVLHTYAGSAEAPAGCAPTFHIDLPADYRHLARDTWSALDREYRVMLCEGHGTSPAPTRVVGRSDDA